MLVLGYLEEAWGKPLFLIWDFTFLKGDSEKLAQLDYDKRVIIAQDHIEGVQGALTSFRIHMNSEIQTEDEKSNKQA